MHIEELRQRYDHLQKQVAIGGEYGEDGALRVELADVKAKLSAVPVDTPTQDVIELLQREAAISLKITCGEAELERVGAEIERASYAQDHSMHLT